jgi:formimidoylglutamate deiminase
VPDHRVEPWRRHLQRDDLSGRRGAFGFGSDSNIHIALFDELKTLEYSQRLRDRSRAALATSDGPRAACCSMLRRAAGRRPVAATAGRIAAGALADVLGLDDDNEWLCNRTGDAALDSLIFGGGGQPASAMSGAPAAMW